MRLARQWARLRGSLITCLVFIMFSISRIKDISNVNFICEYIKTYEYALLSLSVANAVSSLVVQRFVSLPLHIMRACGVMQAENKTTIFNFTVGLISTITGKYNTYQNINLSKYHLLDVLSQSMVYLIQSIMQSKYFDSCFFEHFCLVVDFPRNLCCLMAISLFSSLPKS